MASTMVNEQTDPTGRWFLSYRGTRLPDIKLLMAALHEHGIPTWQDRKNLASEPTVEAVNRALRDPLTAGAVLWVSQGVSTSQVILQEEAPLIIRRARADDGFCCELCVTDGLTWGDASAILNMPASLEDASAAWNVRQVEEDPLTDVAAATIAETVLQRRLDAIHRSRPAGEPVHLGFYAHGLATPAFEPGYFLRLDWTEHFAQRHADEAAWRQRLLPALARVVKAIRSHAPGRPVEAHGFASLASGFALGRAFMEPSGIPLVWRQVPQGERWSLSMPPSDSGFQAHHASHNTDGRDLAVLVSVRGPVEPAVAASSDDLPKFRAMLRIEHDAEGARNLSSGEAVHLARLVADEIRKARQRTLVVQRTHLFFSGPVGLAVLIGQQLNAVGPVQTYEYVQSPDDAVGRYVPAALLCDPITP